MGKPLVAALLLFLVSCGDDEAGGNGFEACCEDSGTRGSGLGCCDASGPDINVNEGDAIAIDGQVNHVSVNRGVVLFEEGACVCGYLNINSDGARVYVDDWDDRSALEVANDTNVNAEAYLYVGTGGFRVGNNFANNSGATTLVEGDLSVDANLYLNAASLLGVLEGSYEANPFVDNGGELLTIGEPDIEYKLSSSDYAELGESGNAVTGDLDQASEAIAGLLAGRFSTAPTGRYCRVRFDYDADTLRAPIQLPMLFQSTNDRWLEVRQD